MEAMMIRHWRTRALNSTYLTHHLRFSFNAMGHHCVREQDGTREKAPLM